MGLSRIEDSDKWQLRKKIGKQIKRKTESRAESDE